MKEPQDVQCKQCGNKDDFLVEYEKRVIHLRYDGNVEGFVEVESTGSPKYKCKMCDTELSKEDAETLCASWYVDRDE